jgi:hypothetical protein
MVYARPGRDPRNVTATHMAGESRLEHAARAVEGLLPWPGDTVLVAGDLASSLSPLLKHRFPWKQFVPGSLESIRDGAAGGLPTFPCVVIAQSRLGPGSSPHVEACVQGLGPGARLLVLGETEPAPFRRTGHDRPSDWALRETAGGAGLAPRGPVATSGPFSAFGYSRRADTAPSRDHFRRVMGWLYERVLPADGADAETEPRRVLTSGKALCLGYALTLGHILRRDGFRVEYATVLARDHERGRGAHRVDSHEVLQATETEGGVVLLDPMANVLFPHGLLEVLRRPSLATRDTPPDARHRERRYNLYDSPYFYERAFEVCVRTSSAVTAFDSSNSWRAVLKVLSEIGRRSVYRRRREGSWRRVLAPLKATGSLR